MRTPPQAVIIAGPNGSGKSTAAGALLPSGMPFVNADLIAQELSGDPGTTANIRAGRLLLDRVDWLQAERQDFAFETTLATVMLPSRIKLWRDAGYQVRLLFFWLPSPDLAVERVRSRVRAGGHDVPEETVRRRFVAGVRNLFALYLPLVDFWRVYDNSGQSPALVAKGAAGAEPTVMRPASWNQMRSFR